MAAKVKRKAVAEPAVDHGADGEAMTTRKQFRIIETVVAGVRAKQMEDSHLVDRLHHYAQITDRQYEAAQRLLEMCAAAGLLPGACAPYGRIGRGDDMPDAMAEARAAWNHLLGKLGSQRADLLTSVMHERHPGVRYLATVQSAFDWLADRWGLAR